MWKILRTIGLLLAGAMAGFIGAAAILRASIPSRGDESSDVVNLVTVFDSLDVKSRSRAFRGGTLTTWFGGAVLDLREAQLAPDAELVIGTAFGGVLVRVPATWRIECHATAIIGGVDAPSGPPQPDDPDAPVLAVRASSLFGGISIQRAA